MCEFMNDQNGRRYLSYHKWLSARYAQSTHYPAYSIFRSTREITGNRVLLNREANLVSNDERSERCFAQIKAVVCSLAAIQSSSKRDIVSPKSLHLKFEFKHPARRIVFHWKLHSKCSLVGPFNRLWWWWSAVCSLAFWIIFPTVVGYITTFCFEHQ